MFGKRLSRALVITVVASLVLTVMAFADTAIADGDIATTTVAEDTLALGAFCPDADDTITPVNFHVKRSGNSAANIYAADSTVTFTLRNPNAIEQPAAGDGVLAFAFSASPAQITMPSAWVAANNNTLSPAAGGTVTVTPGTVPGSYSGKVKTLASGVNESVGTAISNNADLTITWMVLQADDEDCVEEPPSNNAPVVTATWNPTSVGCRVSSTLGVSFTDADSTSWSAAIDWDYDGTNFDNDKTLASVTSPFSEPHAYNVPGTYTAAVRVTDNQGATGMDTDDLTVNQTYSANFLQPLDGSSPSKLIANTMKKGRVVPIKVTITDDCTLAMVNDPTTAVGVRVTTATFTMTSTDAVETFSDAGQSAGQEAFFRWSPDASVAGGGFWIFNLDSNGLQVNTCYKVQPEIGGIATSNFAVLKPTK